MVGYIFKIYRHLKKGTVWENHDKYAKKISFSEIWILVFYIHGGDLHTKIKIFGWGNQKVFLDLKPQEYVGEIDPRSTPPLRPRP